jgi:hypothetical protein
MEMDGGESLVPGEQVHFLFDPFVAEVVWNRTFEDVPN